MKSVQSAIASADSLSHSIAKSIDLIFSQQSPEGYWWYTLEANETIGAGFVQLMHFIGNVDHKIQEGLARRILSQQESDGPSAGSWALFFGGPGDLSITVECYFALRLAGYPPTHKALIKAKQFILNHGGLTQIRIFTRIHLALFGLVPWSACPSMPLWFILFPSWGPVSIYNFSSWARASIVPLLLIDAVKPVRTVPITLDELYRHPKEHQNFSLPKASSFFSLSHFFIRLDKILKWSEKWPYHPGKKGALRRAEKWVRKHIERTEDIYPAMAYAVLALSGMGYPNSDPTIQKALAGLKRFQQPVEVDPRVHPNQGNHGGLPLQIHQQCCISPNWDTPWAGIALLESGVNPDDPRILKAANYMIEKEIHNFRGDWKVKNPQGPAGGWAFEFQNDYFPDVDDTIEAIFFLRTVDLPDSEKEDSIQRGLAWLLSMQCKNGGWAAFDKNNTSKWVNKIPFSDHGACLDPPTPDITGRMIELLAQCGYTKDHPVITRAIRFIEANQTSSGAWRGRWGVNYIYGTWCVVQGLMAIGIDPNSEAIKKAIYWLKLIQNKNGGWGESCLSDAKNQYVSLEASTASQTAWALLALIAAGEKDSIAVQKGIQWLLQNQKSDGGWNEPYYTGTGFPGHFYIRYHGYRYYFPLLALGRYNKS